MAIFVYVTEAICFKDFYIKQKEIGIELSKDSVSSLIQFVDCPEPISVLCSKIQYFDPDKTGDQFENKVCNRCNRLLPVSEFSINQNGKNNRQVRRPSCNDCRKIIDGKNIPPKTYAEWNKNRPNKVIWECPICKKRTIPGLTSKIVIDHNHATGMPNAWLCDSCNTGLGRFNDDIEVLENAIEYLKKYKQK